MAEQTLSQELLCPDGGRTISYLFYLAQWQLLRADYCSAAASLKEALFHSNQVITLETSHMFYVYCVSPHFVNYHVFKLK